MNNQVTSFFKRMQRFFSFTGQRGKMPMKTLMLFLTVALLMGSCSKNKEAKTVSVTSAWKETDNYYSIGGPIIWKKTEPSEAEIIEFRNDNVFYSSQHPELNRYIIEEMDMQSSTAKLKLYEAGQKDTTYWFIKTLTPNTIEVGFGGCIEGCGKRFASISENKPL